MEILNEADTKAKLIDPALHRIGWTEDLIHQSNAECGIPHSALRNLQSKCGIDIIDGKPKRREHGRIEFKTCKRIL